MRERRRDYELMFIISPLHASEEDVAAVIQRIQQTIEAEGGAITAVNHSSPWGRRKLAYPIRAYAGGEASRRSFSEGFYVLLHFNLAASSIVELERTLKLADPVLRYLVTVVDRKEKLQPVLDLEDTVADDVIEAGVEADEEEEDEYVDEYADQDEDVGVDDELDEQAR